MLAASIRDVLGEVGAKGIGITSLRRGAPELETMHSALRSLYASGAAIDWQTFFGPGSYTALPKYPWQLASPWDEGEHIERRRVEYHRHPMISDVETSTPRRFLSELSFGSLPFLEDHHVAGAVIFPGRGLCRARSRGAGRAHRQPVLLHRGSRIQGRAAARGRQPRTRGRDDSTRLRGVFDSS